VRLWQSNDIEANCNLDGVNRLGGFVLDHQSISNSSLYHLISGNERFRRWISTVNGRGPLWPSDFPIELREYGRKSRGMSCHQDLLMYIDQSKDIEVVMTIDNDSECTFRYYDRKQNHHDVKAERNSLTIVQPNSARHCVSPTLGGTRSILKFIFVGDYRKSAQFNAYTVNRCGANNPNRKALEFRRTETRSGAAIVGSVQDAVEL